MDLIYFNFNLKVNLDKVKRRLSTHIREGWKLLDVLANLNSYEKKKQLRIKCTL